MKTTSATRPALPFLREQGLAAVPRLAMYAHKEDCGSLLVQINHPQVIRILLLVADKNKPSLQRVAKYSKTSPMRRLPHWQSFWR